MTWKPLMFFLTVLAFAFYAAAVFGSTVIWGKSGSSAYVKVINPSGPKCPPGIVLEFTVHFTNERR